MGRISRVISVILIVSHALSCHSEPVDPSIDQDSGQNSIFRRPLIPGPPRPDQSLAGSNTTQNRIQTRAPAASWPWSRFIPMQAQSQRTDYAPVRSRVNFSPEQRFYPSLVQQKPMPGADLQPVVKDEVVMQTEFEPANTVQVQCGEVSVTVQAQQDFLGSGQVVDPSDLTLGGCPFVGFDDHARIVVFESALQGCGSTLTTTEDTLTYSFVLMYSPVPVKTNEATVAIRCSYPRKRNVSSNALKPTWMPYVSLKAAEDRLTFSLKLMTDDWRFQRSSSTYVLGEFINLEASVHANRGPLRVFVESCVATLGPGGNAATVYTFIENNGCMIDSKLTGSGSTFMPRIQEDKLQFKIKAFRFKQDDSGAIYISCHLKATATSSPVDSVYKACSFIPGSNSWVAVNGDDHLCGCCETSCTMRKARSLDTEDSTLEDEATVGPISVMLLQIQESSQASSEDEEFSVNVVLVTSLTVVVAVLCVVVFATLFYPRCRKLPTLICE